MELTFWPRAISLGALIGAAVIVHTACGSPPEPEPVTDVEPALLETVLSDEEEELVVLQRKAESVEPEPVAEPGADAETQVERLEFYHDVYLGAGTPSVEEHIYLSEVIVRAWFVSEDDGLLNFSAVEHLKGAGSRTFSVPTPHGTRDTQWDHREAILVLDSAPGGDGVDSASVTFHFADTTRYDYGPYGDASERNYRGRLRDGYTIDSASPVWLPSSENGGAARSPSDIDYVTESTEEASDPTLSLADLRAKIAWVEGGQGIEGYEKCLRRSLNHMRVARDWEAFHGEPPTLPHIDRTLKSGMPKGQDITSWGETLIAEPGYSHNRIVGEDAALFDGQAKDDDHDPSNGYNNGIYTVRPLPAGEYRFTGHPEDYFYAPCKFKTFDTGATFAVTVTAPEGTVYEALFDPTATGFGSGGGELTPATFTADGTTSAITGLTYDDGKVVLETDPFNRLEGFHLHLIKLDGTIDIALPGDAATQDEANKRLSWDVPMAPWVDGDKLMLRLTSVAHPHGPPEDSSAR